MTTSQSINTILVVDDEPHIRDVMRFALEKAGMAVVQVGSGPEALAAFDAASIDLVILDINLPGLDGLDVCRALRKRATTPILFVSARDEEFDRILGLELGGDDYVTKPFSARELVARVNVILRRVKAPPVLATPPGQEPALQHGGVRLEAAQHLVTWNGVPLILTATEFQILTTLLERPTHVRDRASLIVSAYDHNVHVSDRTIDSHIRHIRLKFQAVGAQHVIETVHGVGYRLGSCT